MKRNNKKLTAVVCNAGVTDFAPFEVMDMDTYKWIMDTKVNGHLQLIHRLVRPLRES